MSEKIIVIEDADSPETMRIMRNPHTGINLLFNSEEEARNAVIFMNPVQPVQFIRMSV